MAHKKKMQKKDKYNNFEDLYKRAIADYQNLRKQTVKEKEEFAKYANANIILEILPIYENLKIAVEHADKKDHDEWLKGVRYVIKQFEDLLQNNGVEIINPVDSEFNPEEHEAVEQMEAKDEEQANKVAKVIKQGYKMRDKIIQPAKVAVYNKRAQE